MLKIHVNDQNSVTIKQDKAIDNLRNLVGLYVFIQEDEDDNIIFYAGQDEYSEFLDKIGLNTYECVGGMVCDIHGNIDAIDEDILACYPIQWDNSKKAFKVGMIKKAESWSIDENWEDKIAYIDHANGIYIFYYLYSNGSQK